MRVLCTVDNCVSATVTLKGNGKGFVVRPEVRNNFVVLHPVPRAEQDKLRDGEEWYGALGDILEVSKNPKTGHRIFVQPFIPLKKVGRIKESVLSVRNSRHAYADVNRRVA